jgi:hypothetical protein
LKLAPHAPQLGQLVTTPVARGDMRLEGRALSLVDISVQIGHEGLIAIGRVSAENVSHS